MSNFLMMTKHPKTNEFESATWIDDYFGPRKYGIKFNSGDIFRPDECSLISSEEFNLRETSNILDQIKKVLSDNNMIPELLYIKLDILIDEITKRLLDINKKHDIL